MTCARVAVNVPGIDSEYDYLIPPELEGRLGAGHLVTVPFGRQTVQGVVLELAATFSVADPKPVQDLLDPLPVLTDPQVALARWMAGHFLGSLASMVTLMLPAGLGQQADVLYSLRSEALPLAGQETSAVQGRLLALLQEKGPLRGRQVDRHFARVDWRRTAQSLLRRGVLASQSILPPPGVRPRQVRTARLAVPPAQAQAAMPTLGKTPSTLARRQAALRHLLQEPGAVEVAWIYAGTGCNLSDLQELAERGLVALGEAETWRDPLEKIDLEGRAEASPPSLTPEQQAAWAQILPAFDRPPASFLLQGVTGSGKTELYLQAAAEALRRGRSALILVPEIAITPQAVRRFMARFPGQVGLVHSRLSTGERYDTWRRARLGLLKVIIGPRSALFSPLPAVGLVVADECHDGSYYQSEPPFYHAITAAREYARLCGALCILGSATPSIVQRHQAGSGGGLILSLPRRIPRPGLQATGLPPVRVVDMRLELKSGSRGIFSRPLVEALAGVLERGEQAILYLNRRGTATHVFCRTCGYVAKCPQCDTPLTFHTDLLPNQGAVPAPGAPAGGGDAVAALTCHHCGYRRRMLQKCPACQGTQVRAYGLGSEKVEAEVRLLFPAARVLRWDWETTRRKDAHEIILGHFVAHRADVLVGTQMLAKGLDLPLVTLVGIVLADVGLSLPDPFAAERTFSLLTQVAGRAGRSALGGQVVLQTFLPEHYAVQLAARHDVEGFYAREVEERRRLAYPPFGRLVRLEYRHHEAQKAEAEARRLAALLSDRIAASGRIQTDLIGPVPCFFARLEGLHRWQVVLRGPHPEDFLREMKLASTLPRGWRVEVEPVSLL